MKFWFIFLVVVACLVGIEQAVAQSSIEIQSNTTSLDFPNGLTFFLHAVSEDNVIEQVSLLYRTGARSCTPGNVRVLLDSKPAQEVETSWEWDFRDSGSLPPGAQVTWFWEIRDRAGNITTTPSQILTIEDSDFTWKMLEEGNISLYWVEGGQTFGKTLMRITQDALANLESAAGLAPEGHIRINVYPSTDTLKEAALFLPEWTGGVAIFEHGVIMVAIGDNETNWAAEVIPHELAHLVTNERIFNCLGTSLPTWLSEGLSVSSEGPLTSQDHRLIETGLEQGTLPLLRTLAAGFPADPQKAIQAYAISGAVVRFMLAEFGPEKMTALLDSIKSGLRIDPALQAVYETSTDDLDQAWRASLGYATELPFDSPTPTLEIARTAIPTIALWSPPLGQAALMDEAPPTPTDAVIVQPASPTPKADFTDVTPASSSPESSSGGNPCYGSLGAVGAFIVGSLALRIRRNISPIR